ncbi:hypothetical protein VNO77_16244 [Canavalia gladiata]|uniref:Uncharacterized protein n=1 Tax=Canavalia gladiata TaxID=3824 RepID=A0AAN9QSX8_CANGL
MCCYLNVEDSTVTAMMITKWKIWRILNDVVTLDTPNARNAGKKVTVGPFRPKFFICPSSGPKFLFNYEAFLLFFSFFSPYSCFACTLFN